MSPPIHNSNATAERLSSLIGVETSKHVFHLVASGAGERLRETTHLPGVDVTVGVIHGAFRNRTYSNHGRMRLTHIGEVAS